MHGSHIQLLEDDLIDPNKFLDLIVDLICPSLESTTGIRSVIGKTEFAPALNIALPFKLTASDRETLENLLPLLPDLHGNMSEEEIAQFLTSYSQLGDRPRWEPSVVTEQSRKYRKEEQIYLREEHRVALRNAVASGDVKAVEGSYLPVKFLSIGTFIPRAEAQKYLERLGVFGMLNLPPSKQTDHPPPPLEQENVFIQKVGDKADDEKPLSGEQASQNRKFAGTTKSWTPERLAEVAKYRALHGTKKAAVYFQISEGLIRRKLPKKPKQQPAADVWAPLRKR